MRDLNELNMNEDGEPIMREKPQINEIKEFETEFDLILPDDYIKFLNFSNGGSPEVDSFALEGNMNNLWSIDTFYHLNSDKNSLGNLWNAMKRWGDKFDEKIIPIAYDGGDNQILLDTSKGEGLNLIKLCIHDENFKIIDIANSFSELIDMLFLDPDMI